MGLIKEVNSKMEPEKLNEEENPKLETKTEQAPEKLTISELLRRSKVSLPRAVGAFVRAGKQTLILTEIHTSPDKQKPIATLPEFDKMIKEYEES